MRYLIAAEEKATGERASLWSSMKLLHKQHNQKQNKNTILILLAHQCNDKSIDK